MSWFRQFREQMGGILLYTLLAFGILVALPVAGLIYVLAPSSTMLVHRSIPSPNGRMLAVIYEVQGGATTSSNTQVSIAPANRPFSRDRNPSFLSLHGQHELAVNWVGDKVVQIDLPDGEKIYRNDLSVGDITIEYR